MVVLGVMPQTVEAINHAKAANCAIIVAINKMDKPGANPRRVKEELMAHDVIAEDYGGDVMMIPVSAKTGQGLEDLLDAILVKAEMMELKANPNRYAIGTVLEPLNAYLILAENLYKQPQKFSKSYNFGPDSNSQQKVIDILENIKTYFVKNNYAANVKYETDSRNIIWTRGIGASARCLRE